MRLAAKILLLLAFFVLPSGYCAAAYAESLLARLQEASGRVKSFSCEFTQEKTMTLFSEPVHFRGRLYVDRPDKLRWEFISPIPSVLMLNGTQGLRCDERMAAESFNLKTDPVMRVVAQQLWLWLGGDYSGLAEQYHVEERDGTTLFVSPTDPASAEYISSVTIHFDDASLQPKKVTIDESGGNLTVIVFSDPELNADLASSLFNDCSNE